jgi:hypothetical protein
LGLLSAGVLEQSRRSGFASPRDTPIGYAEWSVLTPFAASKAIYWRWFGCRLASRNVDRGR